jgi:rubredoxin
MTTTRLTGRILQQVMQKPRLCRDCGDPFQGSNTHRNPRYCATCLPQHSRKCAICKQKFYPQVDADRLCPVHVAHPTLFEEIKKG